MSEYGIGVPAASRLFSARPALAFFHQYSLISSLSRFVARTYFCRFALGQFCIPLLLACFLLVACAGKSHAEYVRSHPWIGKCVTFTKPMVYLTNLSAVPTEFISREEVVRIGRSLASGTFAEHLKEIPEGKDIIVTPVPPKTTFEMTAVVTAFHEGYSLMFAGDVEIPVLRDSQGQLSAAHSGDLELCNSAALWDQIFPEKAGAKQNEE